MAKLVIKLKLSADEDGDTTQNNLHICKICNRKFSCGKAYGGHKRIHSMKRKERKQPIEEIINIQLCDANIAARPRYTKCSFCPKTFRTEKSFEEHIKTHHHGWRSASNNTEPPVLAINDPNNSSSSSHSINALEAEANDDRVNSSGTGEEKGIFTDLAKVLPPSWAITGRRGQNAKADDVLCVSPSSIDMYQGADDLMELSLGKIQAGILPLKKRKMESSSSPPPQEMHNQSCTKPDQAVCKEKIPVLVDKYDKPFASYHALGGHNNAHDHKKQGNDDDLVEGFAGRHRCPHCNKCYVRSRALLAHRRRCDHLGKTQVAMEEAKVAVPRRAFSFDLNELPPPETEAGGEMQQEIKEV